MSDAQFVVDVAATFSGEQTIGQMDALTSKLISAGVSANTFSQAVAATTNALTASRAAAAAANAALAEGNAKYRELEQAANQAAKAQEKSAKLGVVRPEIAAAASAASAALAEHEAELGKLETAAKAAAAKENALADSLGNVKKLASATAAEVSKKAQAESKAASESDRNLKKLRAGLAGVGGPLGSLGAAAASSVDDFRDLEESIGSTGAKMAFFGGAAASVVAVVALVTAAVIAGTIAIAAWAVGLADARRGAALSQQAVEALDPAVASLSKSYASITAQTGQTVPQLNALAKSLEAAKVSAEDMPEALRAAALAETALGQGGSAKFLEDLKKGKIAAGQLSREVQTKIGGIVAKQMRGLGAQSAQLKNEIGRIFGGLEIEPVLLGLQKLVGLFDETTAAGSAIKFLFESIFQPLINNVDTAATALEAFALGVLIGLTKLYIAAKPAIKAISDLFGFDDTGTADTMAMITKAAEYIVPALLVAAGIFVAFAVAVGAVVAVAVGVQVAIYSLIAAVVYAGVQIVSGVIGAWHSVTSFLDSITLEGVGTAIMQGLANGIIAAAGLPLQAITGAVNAAISGAKSLLGIHSPSKVFAEIGGYTAEGFAEGVDEGAPQAQTSLERMADPAAVSSSAGQAGASAGASAGGGSTVTVNLQGATLTFSGLPDAPTGLAQLSEMITRALEGLALQAEGGAPT